MVYKMQISFFSEDEYGKSIGYELLNRGYDVIFDKLTEETSIVFAMCPISAFRLEKYLNMRKELERFEYCGKTIQNVLDIPTWRLNDENWNSYYQHYYELLKKADKIVTISKFTSTQLKEIWNLKSKPLFTQFNNKKLETYKTNVEKNPKSIVAISRLVPHKRFEVLIRALENTDYELTIIGNGPYDTLHRNLIKDFNVKGQLLTNVTDKDLVKHIQRAWLVVHPSEFEGNSLVPKEAVWLNTPVVISDIPVHKEYFKKSVTYFKTNDIEDLKTKIKKHRRDLINAQKLMSNLTIEKTTNKVELWLTQLK
jgi:glycosyltransferase involved in cell wall biosynthesis